MSLTLKQPPWKNPVDDKGGVLSFPWHQWIKNLSDVVTTLIGSNGGSNLSYPYSQFYDTTTQTASAGVNTAVTFNTSNYSNGISIGSPSSRMVVSVSGIYFVKFDFQTSNTSASVDDFTCWLRKNGTDIANSGTISSTPAKHGAVNGHLIVSASYIIQLAASDYVEIYWTTDSGTTSISTLAAGVSPVHPQSPGAAVTFNYISNS